MFDRFKFRSNKLERLDTGDYTADEYYKWQQEMWFIHRVFGEVRALRTTLYPQVLKSGSGSISILDVGAGSGDILRTIGRWSLGRRAMLVGAELDGLAVKAIAGDEMFAVQCDGFRLPFADSCFDHVTCSLVLHHLDNESAVKLIEEMRRVARGKIYVVDLHRSPAAYYLFKAFAFFAFQRFTCEDGALSILKSFTPSELRSLARKAGLNNIEITRSALYRLVLSGD